MLTSEGDVLSGLSGFVNIKYRQAFDLQYLEQLLSNCEKGEIQNLINIAENNYIRQKKFQATTNQPAEKSLEQVWYEPLLVF